jgi:hypothetical protein
MSGAVPLAPCFPLWVTQGLHVLGAFATLREATITRSLITSVCPSFSSFGNLSSHFTDFKMKFDICGLYGNVSGKFEFDYNLA